MVWISMIAESSNGDRRAAETFLVHSSSVGDFCTSTLQVTHFQCYNHCCSLDTTLDLVICVDVARPNHNLSTHYSGKCSLYIQGILWYRIHFLLSTTFWLLMKTLAFTPADSFCLSHERNLEGLNANPLPGVCPAPSFPLLRSRH